MTKVVTTMLALGERAAMRASLSTRSCSSVRRSQRSAGDHGSQPQGYSVHPNQHPWCAEGFTVRSSVIKAFHTASNSATDPPIHTARLTPLRIERASRKRARARERSSVRSRARMVISLWILESVAPSWPPSISHPPHVELSIMGNKRWRRQRARRRPR